MYIVARHSGGYVRMTTFLGISDGVSMHILGAIERVLWHGIGVGASFPRLLVRTGVGRFVRWYADMMGMDSTVHDWTV
jgi:hypothetical protein